MLLLLLLPPTQLGPEPFWPRQRGQVSCRVAVANKLNLLQTICGWHFRPQRFNLPLRSQFMLSLSLTHSPCLSLSLSLTLSCSRITLIEFMHVNKFLWARQIFPLINSLLLRIFYFTSWQFYFPFPFFFLFCSVLFCFLFRSCLQWNANWRQHLSRAAAKYFPLLVY